MRLTMDCMLTLNSRCLSPKFFISPLFVLLGLCWLCESQTRVVRVVFSELGYSFLKEKEMCSSPAYSRGEKNLSGMYNFEFFT